MKLRVASLFAGCGGTDLGLIGGFKFLNKVYTKNPVEIVYANEIDDRVSNIFEANFDIEVDRCDIRKRGVRLIPDHDILTAGFPCQSFSILAQNPPRLGISDEKGKLFFEIVRIIKGKKPKVVICENVKGLISANRGKTFPLILKEFEKLGYTVSYRVLNASDFGVPQNRERVFIVCTRNDIPHDFIFPSPVCENPNPLSLALEDNFDDKYYFSKRAVEGMKKSNRKTKGMMNKGRIQDPSRPCNTVTSHLAKVTLNGTDPVVKTNGKYRRFTPREVARIQGFPEKFKLVGSETSQYVALGNAIPPPVFWHITRQVLKLLDAHLSPQLQPSHPLQTLCIHRR